jgi:zinc metalloprotease ZmpB
MRKLLLVLATAGLLIATATSATAAAPGPGTSTGVGSVFVPNPVQSLGDQSLTDQKDADSAVPAAAYHDVTLTNLDGSGFLRGDYATVVSETGNPAYSPTNTFRYTRHQDEFEQVMAYYWVTEAQKYIHTLGFGPRRCGSTSSARTTPSPPTTPRTSCASARAASTTPRTAR